MLVTVRAHTKMFDDVHGSDLLVPTQRPAFDQVNIKLRTSRHDLHTGSRDAAKFEFIKVCFCPWHHQVFFMS